MDPGDEPVEGLEPVRPEHKATGEGAASNGYDAHKNLEGRKRHPLVGSLGLPLSVTSSPPTCRNGLERDKKAKGFEVLPKRWIVEQTFGWSRRDRRLEGLLAEGADYREAHRGGDDPAHVVVASESSVNLTEYA